MVMRWAADPRDLGKIVVDSRGRFEVYIKEDPEYYRGYRTRTYRSIDKAKRKSDKVLAKEKARDDKIHEAQELLRNSERNS
jgi:predicted SPOUT superfamily RNA methylase MTH1